MIQPHHDDDREPDSEPPSKPAISIDIEGADSELADALRAGIHFAAARHQIPQVALEIAIVDEAQMCDFHQQWMNDPSPTDVLTFDLRDDASASDVLEGQIIICEPVARQQAQARGHTWQDEALLYALHGFLHLAGYDDHDDADFERMHTEEDAILVALGKQPIFGDAKEHTESDRSDT